MDPLQPGSTPISNAAGSVTISRLVGSGRDSSRFTDQPEVIGHDKNVAHFVHLPCVGLQDEDPDHGK